MLNKLTKILSITTKAAEKPNKKVETLSYEDVKSLVQSMIESFTHEYNLLRERVATQIGHALPETESWGTAIDSLNEINDYLLNPWKSHLSMNALSRLSRAMGRMNVDTAYVQDVEKISSVLVGKEKRKSEILSLNITSVNSATLVALGEAVNEIQSPGSLVSLGRIIQPFFPSEGIDVQSAHEVLETLRSIMELVLGNYRILAHRELLRSFEIIMTWGLNEAFQKGVQQEDSSTYQSIFLFLEKLASEDKPAEEN